MGSTPIGRVLASTCDTSEYTQMSISIKQDEPMRPSARAAQDDRAAPLGEDASIPYDWHAIESRWQRAWEDARLFATPTLGEGERGCFVFGAYPFTSGSIHVGHVRSYTIADAHARFMRARGERVAFAMGFDSFGLPTELEALKRDMPPREWVARCRERIRSQLSALGYSFDWNREFATCDEDVYRWSQWLFLTLLDRDLVYRREATVDWCDTCHTVLARAEVEDGSCWRCHGPTHLIKRMQWWIRSSAYVAENEARLAELSGWNKAALGAQRAFIGRVDGVELAASAHDGRSVTVFTPHADCIAGAGLVAMSLNFPDLEEWLPNHAVRAQVDAVREGGWRRADRSAKAIPIVETGVEVSVPGVARMLPVIVSPSVDARFGPTAILGIPGKDATDEMIVARLTTTGSTPSAPLSEGVAPAPEKRHAAADYPITRQRAWGSPVPIVHCERCGIVPVPHEHLPVRLPADLRVTATGNALADDAGFVACDCPACGAPARRETDTLDCHFDGLWIWMLPCVPETARPHELFTHPDVAKLLPAEQIVWGMDGAADMISHRTVSKMLRDCGVWSFLQKGEPFEHVTMHGMVTMDGRKMSKHLGNVADPDELLGRVGADTLRFAMLHAAAPRNGFDWSEEGLEHCHRFLARLWQYAQPRLAVGVDTTRDADGADASGSGKLRRQLAKWCDAATAKVTRDLQALQMHRATRNVIQLLASVEDFERRVIERHGRLARADRQAVRDALVRLVQLLAPMAPHIAEELWAQAGNDSFVSVAPWPRSAAEKPLAV
jgi:leucyl-tRNA synthetase